MHVKCTGVLKGVPSAESSRSMRGLGKMRRCTIDQNLKTCLGRTNMLMASGQREKRKAPKKMDKGSNY